MVALAAAAITLAFAVTAGARMALGDTASHRDPGTIATVAGGIGEGPATSLRQVPVAVAIHGASLYVLDQRSAVHMVDLTTGLETAIAGTGVTGFSGDCTATDADPPAMTTCPARLAAIDNQVEFGNALAVDPSGNVYLGETDTVGSNGAQGGRVRLICQQERCDRSHFPLPTGVDHLDRGGITTVAGGGTSDPESCSSQGCPATDVKLIGPSSVTLDAANNILYIGDSPPNQYGPRGVLRTLDSKGMVTTITSCPTDTVDGVPQCPGAAGPTSAAHFREISAVSVDSQGGVYLADGLAYGFEGRIVKIQGTVYSTVAGTDPGAASNLPLSPPSECAWDPVWSQVGVPPAAPCPATAAVLAYPNGVAVDGAGNVDVLEGTINNNGGGNCVRQVQGNLIVDIVGTCGQRGSPCHMSVSDSEGSTIGDNCPAAAATLSRPEGIAGDPAGNLYIADTGNNSVRFVCRQTTSCSVPPPVCGHPTCTIPSGDIVTIAGDGSSEPFVGDGGPATQALLGGPQGLARDRAGDVFIADTIPVGQGASRIRRVDPTGLISTVAGGGSETGDGVRATMAQLSGISDVAADQAGNIYIADTASNRIRFVCLQLTRCTSAGSAVDPGEIATVAGTGASGYDRDGVPATAAELAGPVAVAVGPGGDLMIADEGNNRVREVDGAGVIHTIAGSGAKAGGSTSSGADHGPPTALDVTPRSLALDPAGTLYILDLATGAPVIRRVDPTRTSLTTIAGGAGSGYQDGPAASALFQSPTHIAVDGGGGVYVADTGNQLIRKIAGGVVTTIAGIPGNAGCCVGEGGPATSAQLDDPMGLAPEADGGLLIGDSGSARVREIRGSSIDTPPPTSSPSPNPTGTPTPTPESTPTPTPSGPVATPSDGSMPPGVGDPRGGAATPLDRTAPHPGLLGAPAGIAANDPAGNTVTSRGDVADLVVGRGDGTDRMRSVGSAGRVSAPPGTAVPPTLSDDLPSRSRGAGGGARSGLAAEGAHATDPGRVWIPVTSLAVLIGGALCALLWTGHRRGWWRRRRPVAPLAPSLLRR